jgi:transcriptional regulator with XRE-family HTH domain
LQEAEQKLTLLEDSAESAVNSIGMRVRSLRTARGLGLRELARRTGITASMLSQIERGGVNPSVGTLFRLADCLGTTTDYFFQGESEKEAADIVVRQESRARIELSGGVVWERLTPTDEHDIEFMHTIYPPGAVSAPELMRHSGRDYGVLIRGQLNVTVGFATHTLNPGDAIAFDASMPHRLANPGPGEAETIWIVLDRNLTATSRYSSSFESTDNRRKQLP